LLAETENEAKFLQNYRDSLTNLFAAVENIYDSAYFFTALKEFAAIATEIAFRTLPAAGFFFKR